MAQSSWPYDGDSVQETEWMAMSRLWRRSGVIDDADNELAVSAVTGELQVSVATGQAWLDGFYFSSDAAETLTLEAADLNDDRIDLVVARSDRSAGKATLEVITGTPAASPTAPTVTQDHEGSDVYEIALAEVLVETAASNVDGNVTDVRTFSLTPQGDAVQVVEHGADSTVARTSDAELVLWVGSVEPDNGVESDLYLRTTDGHRLYHDGSGWIDPLDNATPQIVTKEADESVASSTTLQDDDHLTFPVLNGETWVWIMGLTVGAGDESADFAAGWSAPSGSGRIGILTPATGATLVDPTELRVLSTDGFDGSEAMRIGIDNVSPVSGLVWCYFTATADGSITLQWAQKSSSATATTLLKGSFLVAWKAA